MRGDARTGLYAYDQAPPEINRRQGAGSVHHVAFACRPEEILQWRSRVEQAGGMPTPVIDRFYFRSVYFREPSGVLFELATMGPGFAVDEDQEHLGESLSLPPDFEELRPQSRGHAASAPLSAVVAAHGLAALRAHGTGTGC